MIYTRKPEFGKQFLGVFFREPLMSYGAKDNFVDVHAHSIDFIHEDKFNIVAPTELSFWND